MLNTDSIYQIIADSSSIEEEKIVYRNHYMNFLKSGINKKPIKVLSGFRRSGKSFLLKLLAIYLKKNKHIADENIFFINFEHDLLFSHRKVKNLRELFENYREKIWKKGKIYIFLDEIQNVEGWESFVRTLYESGSKNYDIYITGSNSSLLSGEFSSALSGRTIEMNVYPLSFLEFLAYNDLILNNENDFYKNKLKIKQLFHEYFYHGGIIESINLPKELKKNYFDSLFKKVLIDDIIKRFNIENIQAIDLLYRFIISDIGSILSFANIQNSLKKSGINISIPTLHTYTNYLREVFGIFEMKKFDWKLHSVFDKSCKYFAVDNGLISALHINKNSIENKLLENLIFLELHKSNSKIYFGRDEKGKEIDFVIQKNGEYEKIQATIELNDGNINRELNNFVLAQNYKLNGRNVLISLEEDEETITHKNTKIEKRNIVKWLCGF